MFFHYIFSRIKSCIFVFLGLFKRSLCILSKRRRDSVSDCEVLHTVSVNNNATFNLTTNQGYVSRKKQLFWFYCGMCVDFLSFFLQNERDWNSWDDSPRTINEHIEQYRERLTKAQMNAQEEPAIDFFQVNRFLVF